MPLRLTFALRADGPLGLAVEALLEDDLRPGGARRDLAADLDDVLADGHDVLVHLRRDGVRRRAALGRVRGLGGGRGQGERAGDHDRRGGQRDEGGGGAVHEVLPCQWGPCGPVAGRRCGDRAKGCGSRAMNAESAGAVVMLCPSSPWGRRSLGGKAPVYLSAVLLPPLAQREEVAALLADVGGQMSAPAVESRRRWGRSRPSSSPAGGAPRGAHPAAGGADGGARDEVRLRRAGGRDPAADHPGARRPRVDGTDGARHRRAEHPRVRRAAPPRARRGGRRPARRLPRDHRLGQAGRLHAGPPLLQAAAARGGPGRRGLGRGARHPGGRARGLRRHPVDGRGRDAGPARVRVQRRADRGGHDPDRRSAG